MRHKNKHEEMKTTQEKLTAAIERAERQLVKAFENALTEGITTKCECDGGYIGNKYIVRPSEGLDYDASIVLHVKSDLIREAISESTDALEHEREQLRKKLAGIDEELNRRAQK